MVRTNEEHEQRVSIYTFLAIGAMTDVFYVCIIDKSDG